MPDRRGETPVLLERETRLELATSCLGSKYSTTELLPHSSDVENYNMRWKGGTRTISNQYVTLHFIVLCPPMEGASITSVAISFSEAQIAALPLVVRNDNYIWIEQAGYDGKQLLL